jgi:hypothetical protein
MLIFQLRGVVRRRWRSVRRRLLWRYCWRGVWRWRLHRWRLPRHWSVLQLL